MKSDLVKKENEEHFWEIVKKIVERKQNKANGHREDKTEGVCQSINA